jgi:hypothetical protein
VASARRGCALHVCGGADWRRIAETYWLRLEEADAAAIEEILAGC